MVRVSIALTLLSAGLSFALPQVSVRQNGGAGSENVGKGNGQQFITGECTSPADCASGCCVEQDDGTAQCKARVVTEQAGKSCDFGGGSAGNGGASAAGGDDANAAENDGGTAANNGADDGAGSGSQADGGSGAAGSENVGKGNGQQFITGECTSPADCASGCCVEQDDGTAQCKARVVTEQAGKSCDFGGGSAGNGTDTGSA
ncbi:hypothetical protein VUR80DRAFT_6046 [Thermomyces stellatus]